MFIVLEGPNGVGKTTIGETLVAAVVESSRRAVRTAEPSATPLGQAIRELEASMPPEALALSCAADRYDHIAREIQPQLAAGSWVVCDRYVASSLVLQRIDGLDFEWVWELNKAVLQPDLIIYLEDDPDTITRRLSERSRYSRLELRGSSSLELEYFRDARDFLAHRGWAQTTIDCRSLSPADVVAEIMARCR